MTTDRCTNIHTRVGEFVCVREIPIDATGERGTRGRGRGGLYFMCECAQGELSSMRTGDTASYLLYDFCFR